MSDQAPNIDVKPGDGGRLVYDKKRRTIVAQHPAIETVRPDYDHGYADGVEWATVNHRSNREEFLTNRLADRGEEIERMREAFRFIIDGYPRNDISHEDFRVQAYKAALYATGMLDGPDARLVQSVLDHAGEEDLR